MNGPIFVVTGTDTGIGKTVFAAALVQALGARYWKPVQAGLAEETDSQVVARLSGADPSRILSEAWRLTTPVSPHLAAEIDGVSIDPDDLTPPRSEGPLVVEGAGGLMVPLDRDTLTIDLFARWGAPVILCGRTSLGAINHALLSLEALAARRVPVLGMAFIGDQMADTQATVAAFSGVKVLGRLPFLDPLTSATLRRAFADHFQLADFTGR
ncbi:MAG: ATP-dependent dethiobiotin synthetase BioD [Caulobacteraceae bacterium]|nr:ATP-dependent dethiobiotin synthetase BioD [Caulobacteraceae bacterium]